MMDYALWSCPVSKLDGLDHWKYWLFLLQEVVFDMYEAVPAKSV